MKHTLYGKPVSEVTQEEALAFCRENRDKYIKGCDTIDEGIRSYECLEGMLEEGHLKPSDLPEHGMSDQEL